MRERLVGILIMFAFYLFLDAYTYFGLKSLFTNQRNIRIFQAVYLLSSIFVIFSFYQMYVGLNSGSFFRSASANFYLGIFFTAIVSKMVFVGLMMLQDGGRVFYALFDSISGSSSGENISGKYLPSRRKFLTLAAAGLAAIPFSGMLYGITRGKYRYTINRVKLSFKDLPAAFNGFKIVQISDIHAGSLDSPDDVQRGVQMINDELPDAIMFTGDLVNSQKKEVDPFIDIFAELKAKHGKFAVLGNHDYYGAPRDSREDKTDEYWKDFFSKYEAMGFNLLNNDSVNIEKQGEQISILGVENWGAGRWFPKLGDLDKALMKSRKDNFCVLMSHDPTHWDEKVIPHQKHIHLTLSGHTHGFQFGINMPGFKWSPAQYRYERWMGLYEKAEQYLYVNRGFGFLGFPGRVGMWPEITVIELTT